MDFFRVVVRGIPLSSQPFRQDCAGR